MSWHSSTSDWAPAGTSSQAMCGLRLLDSLMWLSGSVSANAHLGGIMPPSVKESLQIFIASLLLILLGVTRAIRPGFRYQLDPLGGSIRSQKVTGPSLVRA